MVFLVVSAVLCICVGSLRVKADLTFTYHDYSSVTQYLHEIAEIYPQYTYLYTIGASVQERELWVVAIAAEHPERHVALRPEVKYVGNMHGNEVISREVLLHLIEHLVTGCGQDELVTEILNHSRVHIMVSMNPDGFEDTYINQVPGSDCMGLNGRYNAKGRDLNRNFPDYFHTNSQPQQVETAAVIEWVQGTQFVLSANFHGGALVANYPYDTTSSGSRRYSKSPDDDVFKHLARTYSQSHATMYTGGHCGENFEEGITNGAAWYPITGGMQDYNYVYAGCLELTMELSCCKYPTEDTLASYWSDNKDPLIKYLLQAQRGVKGYVKDINNNTISGARIAVAGREAHHVTSSPDGEFWRLLLPGDYTLKVSAEDFESKEIPVEVGDEEVLTIVVVLEEAPHVNTTLAEITQSSSTSNRAGITFKEVDLVSVSMGTTQVIDRLHTALVVTIVTVIWEYTKFW